MRGWREEAFIFPIRVAVWVGTDGTASIGDKETGGKAALPVWSAIMEALPNVPGERFPVPDDVVLLPSDTHWLGYRRGDAPKELLDVPELPADEPLPTFGYALPAGRVPAAPVPTVQPMATAPLDEVPLGTGDLEAGAGDPETFAPVSEP